ncbi:MAG: hypothetical protein V4760_11940 [Bdellovibrionota bacterium]
MIQDYAPLSISFIVLVALLYSALIMGALYANNRVDETKRWPVRLLRLTVGGFLLITGIFALDRYFTDFSGFPPRIMVAISISFVGTLILAFRPIMKRWLEEFPQAWLIGFQSFRIIVEIQLYYLAMTPLFPKMMTLEGANFDIVTGVIAIPVALWVSRLEKSGSVALAGKVTAFFNVIGLALLINVAARGLLSAPTELQAIHVDPPPIAIGAFPFVWLPTFVVPFAALLHILSLRKLALRK